MKNLITKYLPTLSGVLLGGIGGYIYWRYIGCESGTCPITSSPINSALWGMLMGGLLFNAFLQKENKQKKE
ncbi:hypothetical protein FQ707_04420 [Bacteroidaceae bacterium HV4-6-C5C]|jgi:hypothetical protein|nr:hypothetical protein FQ707_04420 [Bacteroidaceae bacterium HV4-6-C5C]